MPKNIVVETQLTSSRVPSGVFAFAAGCVGFVVDLAALVALLNGNISLPAGSFLADSPFALAVFTYFSMLYSVMLIVYFGRSAINRRWACASWAPNPEVENGAVTLLAGLLWLPLFLLWSVVIWKAGQAGGHNAFTAFVFVWFAFANVLMGAFAIREATSLIDQYFNPPKKR